MRICKREVERMRRKIIGILICMLLVGTILPVSGTLIIDNTTSFNKSGNTLYVGGSGVGNYSKIQDAINDSVDGDTVFVYDDSSPYYENVVVNKSIFLIGEDKDTTIIDGNNVRDVIEVSADSVEISGFTIQNSSHKPGNIGAGIKINSDDCVIINNIFLHNFHMGAEIRYADNCYISKNSFSYNHRGIRITDSYQVTVENNTIQNNSYGGIEVYRNRDVINILNNIIINNSEGLYIFNILDCVNIKGNVISGNRIGILNPSSSCTISENIISSNSEYGIHLFWSERNLIYKNNFVDNGVNVNMEFYFRAGWGYNKWCYLFKGNYWDDWSGSGIKIIHGKMYLTHGWENDIIIPWYNFDWFPAKEPYDI
jgi:parallel beta-helix repeat protein